jgi:type I restriction enzyme M protein
MSMSDGAAPKTDIYDIADRLWETADELRANSHLKAGEYSIPVLGLIFLGFAGSRHRERAPGHSLTLRSHGDS